MQPENAMRRLRRAGRVSDAVDYSGISRSSLYLKSKKYRGLFRKDGNTTIVDFDVLDQVIDDLPIAETVPTSAARASAEA